jgi:integrase/recombinase XerD
MKQHMQASAYHLKPPEIRKLIIAAPNFRDRCVIKTLYWLGLRRQELVNLDVRDIDFGRKRVTVRKGKGGKTRIVPMIDDEYIGDLKHLISHRTAGPVFLSNQDWPVSIRRVNYIVETLGEKAGVQNPNPRLKHLNPHIFRHSGPGMHATLASETPDPEHHHCMPS